MVIKTIVAIILALLLSFFIDYAKKYNFLLMGFIIIFGIAAIAKYITYIIIKKIYEPKLIVNDSYYFSLWQFIGKISQTNFGNFVLYTAFLYFFVMIASPFFAVYMLKDLGFTYFQFVFVSLGASLSTMLFTPIIGKFADRFGNSRILHFGGWLIPLVPLAWLFSPSPYYLFAIEFIFSGLAWSAFNLGSSNYIYDTVSPQKRGFAVAYYSLLAGIGTFFGSLAGGFLAQYLSISFMNIFLFIFLISAVGRLIVSLIFLPKIHEVRKVKKFTFSKIHPIHEIYHQLRLGARGIGKGVLFAFS